MTTKTVRLIAFIVLLIHGAGHLQGVAAGLGLKINNSSPAQSWLLKSWSSGKNKRICLVLFFVTAFAGISAALGLRGLFLPDLWQPLAIITAVLSTICLLLFPNGFAMFFNKAGAIAVNLIIYYSLVFSQNWPDALFND
jgi:hypothetical protein